MWLRGLSTGLLAATAWWLGEYSTAGPCYFVGRLRSLTLRLVPLAWAPEAFGHYAIWFGMSLVWLAAWTAFALWLYRNRRSLLWLVPPMVVFLASAFEGSRMNYACNIM